MTNQAARADAFRKLHVPGDPLIIFNAWDAGSARAVARAGARAIGTGSWSVAAAHGYADGEKMPLDLAIANLERIVASVELPVSIDLEAGYGPRHEDVAHSVTLAIKAGAIGINLEDGLEDEHRIRNVNDMVDRIRAARAAADSLAVPLFINARTDFFLQAEPSRHDASLLASAKERAAAYAAAGASGLFVPCIFQAEHIRELCAATALPVNVMMLPSLPSRAELAKLGVARISHGPGPYRVAMEFVEQAAREALSQSS
jgi:2-methylisocitrate lyase-like PEP mutase family enzyme